MQILATQTATNIATLQETDYLSVEVIRQCKNTKNLFWHETFSSFLKVRENFLAEYPNHRLLQLINGNNLITSDGRPAYISSMHQKTLATAVNSDFSHMTTNQYMIRFENLMWIKKPKFCAEYSKFKDKFSKCIERTAQFKPHLDLDSTLNKVIPNKVKKGCRFYYKCLSYYRRKYFNWEKQKLYWENIFKKTYKDAEWLQIIHSLRDIKNNNYHKEHQLRIFRNNIVTNKRLGFIVPGTTKYCDHCTDKVEDMLHCVYECPNHNMSGAS